MIDDGSTALSCSEHGDPFALLGPHVRKKARPRAVVIRAFFPKATQVTVVPLTQKKKPRVMTRIHPEGVFEAVFSGQTTVFPYRLALQNGEGHTVEIEDPLVRDCNPLYQSQPALHQVDYDPAGFQWIDCNDAEQSVVFFLRRAQDPGDALLFVCNFTPVLRLDYHIGVPTGGYWQELLNTDADRYGGSNLGNEGGVWAQEESEHDQPYALELTLPPLAALVFKRRA